MEDALGGAFEMYDVRVRVCACVCVCVRVCACVCVCVYYRACAALNCSLPFFLLSVSESTHSCCLMCENITTKVFLL
jgi:hypothetical protein